MGGANAATGRSYVEAKRAAGIRPSTIRNIACFLQNLDELSHGSDWKNLTAKDVAVMFQRYARSHEPPTAYQFGVNAKAFFAWLHDGELGADFKRALTTRRPKRAPKQLITPEQFEAILRAAYGANLGNRGWMRQALLWILWDTGFRISEALALRVGSVTISPDNSAVHLELPADAPHLKTGPRRIFAVECAPAIRAWLAHHPHKSDANAPLFPSDRRWAESVQPTSVNKILRECSNEVGLAKAITCHQFRHTRATRAAKAGWNEHQLNTYFGWTPGSRESATYVHMSAADVEEKLRTEFGVRSVSTRGETADSKVTEGDPMSQIITLALAALTRNSIVHRNTAHATNQE